MQVLLVEDQAVAAQALQLLLEEEGHEVVIAGSYAEALAALERQVYECVLLDLSLPDGAGSDLVPLIRQRCPRATIYAVTGSAPMEITDEGIHFTDRKVLAEQLGVDDCLSKPIDFAKLLELIG